MACKRPPKKQRSGLPICQSEERCKLSMLATKMGRKKADIVRILLEDGLKKADAPSDRSSTHCGGEGLCILKISYRAAALSCCQNSQTEMAQ
jgi:hypothetical protein